jgi:small subunit ribosomal protein S20
MLTIAPRPSRRHPTILHEMVLIPTRPLQNGQTLAQPYPFSLTAESDFCYNLRALNPTLLSAFLCFLAFGQKETLRGQEQQPRLRWRFLDIYSQDIRKIFIVYSRKRERSPHKGADVSGRIDTYMPNNKAAEKRMRQEQRRRSFNRSTKSVVKTAVTKARVSITAPAIATEEAVDAVRAAISELDKAAKKGVIHKNNAARRKSRLMKQLNTK